MLANNPPFSVFQGISSKHSKKIEQQLRAAWWLGALAALPEDVVQLLTPTEGNPSSRAPTTLFWPLQAPIHM